MKRSGTSLLLGVILFAYACLAAITALTKAPWCDEAWFASPAWNLIHNGHLATTVLEPMSSTWKSVRLDGIDRYTYWVMPLDLILQAGWYRVVGFGFRQMRALSILWGGAALIAWWIIVSQATGNRGTGLLAAALIGADYFFVTQSGDGRMDAMCAALGAAGVAAYLSLRLRDYSLAVAVSSGCAAAAIFTHPIGVIYAGALIWAVLVLDRSGWGLKHVGLAALPFLAGGIAWGLYILKAPQLFLIQFLGNASNRGPGISRPWEAIRAEVFHRYLESYGFAPWSRGIAHIAIVAPLLMLLGVTVCAGSRSIRNRPECRVLLLATASIALFFCFFEGLKTPFYLIHLNSWYWAMAAIAARELAARGGRTMVAGAVAGVLLLQTARIVALARRDAYRHEYLPAAQWLATNAPRESLILGSAEIAFHLGFDRPILDDIHFGYESGKQPAFIVLDRKRYLSDLPEIQKNSPAIYRHATDLMAREYREVFSGEGYRILKRRESGGE